MAALISYSLSCGTLDTDQRMTHTHRLEVVRAHLLEQAGDPIAARDSYLRAAKMITNLPEQRYLQLRAARLHPPPPTNPPDLFPPAPTAIIRAR